jgi:hypothetical protein
MATYPGNWMDNHFPSNDIQYSVYMKYELLGGISDKGPSARMWGVSQSAVVLAEHSSLAVKA